MQRLLLIFSLITSSAVGQVNWDWVRPSGEVSMHEYAYAICTDPNGNSYYTGVFQDSLILGNDTLINAGAYNEVMFVAKVDPAGNMMWAKCPSGSNMSSGNSIVLDDKGRVYVTGTFKGTMTFGNNTVSSLGGFGNVYVARFDANGNNLWLRQSTGPNEIHCNSVAVTFNSEVYITGTFDSSVTFGMTHLQGIFLGGNVFVVKYDSTGTVSWAKSVNGTINTESEAVTADINENAIITGSYRTNIIFGNDTLTGSTNGGASVFITKYDKNGNVVWAKSSGPFPTSAHSNSISNDYNGNILIAGYFDSQIMIFQNDTLTNAGVNDIFILKLDSMGSLQWSRRAGGGDFDRPYCIRTDALGNSYLTGFYKVGINFGNTHLSGPNQELFVVKYDSAGTVLWATDASGTLNEVGYGVSFDAYDNVYVCGSFSSPSTTFGMFTVTNTDIFTGSYDLFVAKLHESPLHLQEYSAAEHPMVFPNPASLNSRVRTTEINYPFRLIIYDASGRMVYNEMQQKGGTVIDADLNAGVYYCRIISDHINNTTKLIVAE